MALTTMKCWLPNVHELFLCVGFSFSGCYSSQQLSQNNILLTTIKFKTFQDYFVKFKDFKALSLVQSNSRLFKTFKAPYRPCYQLITLSRPSLLFEDHEISGDTDTDDGHTPASSSRNSRSTFCASRCILVS